MTERRLSILLTLVIALIYLLFLTHAYFWDGVMFSLQIEDVYAHAQPISTLLSANHLVYSIFGWLAYSGVRALGFNARAITVLQVSNALVGALVVYRLWVWLRRETSSVSLALAGSILFAFGATWWKFSTDADAYIIALRLLLLAVLFALEGNAALAILCHIAAMLFHELAAFGYLPIIVALGTLSIATRKRSQLVAMHVVVTTLVITCAYLVAYRSGPNAVHPTLANWVTDYAPDTPVGHSLPQVLTLTAASYAKLFVGGKLTTIRQQLSPLMVLGLGLCVAALVFLARGLWRPGPIPEVAVLQRLRLVLWSWFVPLALFFLWFDPGNAGHKLMVWPALVMLIATSACAQRHARALLGIALAIAAWNFAVYINPHAGKQADPVVSFAEMLDRQMPPNATVYYASFITDDWYLRYFAPGRRWKPLAEWTPLSIEGPVCLETTALEDKHKPTLSAGRSVQSWQLRTAQHRARVTCWN